jgi:hypothetical protein
MNFGDPPDYPAWSNYKINIFQKCPFCGDNGCNMCRPEVRDGKSVEGLIQEAKECVDAYAKLREFPSPWSKLGDLERMLVVYAIDYGRQHSDEEPQAVEIVNRFKELELR